jgi:hypothetical protein
VADKLKSAYELAMEKLARGARARGEKAARPLTARQKSRIAAIRQEYEAKLAERKILHEAERARAATPEELARIEDGYRRDREHLEGIRERRIQAVREGRKEDDPGLP